MATFWLVAGVIYVTLMVLAYFEILPCGEAFLKPYAMLGEALQRALDSLYR